MNFHDLSNNDQLPLEKRVKHLEREATFVREYALLNDTWRVFFTVSIVTNIILSVLALIK